MIHYSVVIASRALENETELYKETYNSLLDQSIPPENIFVSLYYNEISPYEPNEITFLNLPKSYGTSKTDFVKVYNKWNFANNRIKNQHIVISGDDCYYPKTYFENLYSFLDNNPNTGIVGGKKFEKGHSEIERTVMPSGSGRLYTKQFVEKYFPMPVMNCSETLLMYQNELMKLKNRVCRDTYFVHNRPSTRYSLISSGKCSYELNYPLWNTIARIIVWLITERSFKPYLLYGHINALLTRPEKVSPEIQQFIRKSLEKKYSAITQQLFFPK